MDEEKMQRQMEFIVEQQAQFAEQQVQSATRLGQLEDLLVRFAQATRERFAAADRRAQELDEKIAALIDAQIRTEESGRKMEETVSELGKKIGNLTEVFERHITEGHNGRARPEG